MDYSTLISSSVVSALVAALVTLRTSERKIQVENVTAERAKWRTAMRVLAANLTKAAQSKDCDQVLHLCNQLELNLNPFDNEDQALVIAARNLADPNKLEEHTKEFCTRMALLLKHDWDRAKREAKPWFHRSSEARRISYFDHICDSQATNSRSRATHKSSDLVSYFISLAASAGIIFFLSAGLVEPFQKLIKVFNDTTIHKSLNEWITFFGWSIFYGSIWSATYLWFKSCEKKFLEIWFSK
ncbi:hypothetical protein [Comamonas sp. MYb69]|uniref:hypothetical protein n=1 Tax=Comamonas sp. MYb69 TaxID=1848650 RepID=UPI00309FA7D0